MISIYMPQGDAKLVACHGTINAARMQLINTKLAK
jgi:hypothetical protein